MHVSIKQKQLTIKQYITVYVNNISLLNFVVLQQNTVERETVDV
jgi:hypothetical protein